MTTAQSPLRVLKAQADTIAATLKAAERGEVNPAFDVGGKMAAARARENFVFGIAMDDKILKIEMSWTKIRETSEVALAEYVLRQMREARDLIN